MNQKWFDPKPLIQVDLSAMGLVDLVSVYEQKVDACDWDGAAQVRWWVRRKMTKMADEAKMLDLEDVPDEDWDEDEDEDEDEEDD